MMWEFLNNESWVVDLVDHHLTISLGFFDFYIFLIKFFDDIFLVIVMDDRILQRLSSLVLQEGEDVNIPLEEQDINEGIKEDELSILTHIHGETHPF